MEGFISSFWCAAHCQCCWIQKVLGLWGFFFNCFLLSEWHSVNRNAVIYCNIFQCYWRFGVLYPLIDTKFSHLKRVVKELSDQISHPSAPCLWSAIREIKSVLSQRFPLWKKSQNPEGNLCFNLPSCEFPVVWDIRTNWWTMALVNRGNGKNFQSVNKMCCITIKKRKKQTQNPKNQAKKVTDQTCGEKDKNLE